MKRGQRNKEIYFYRDEDMKKNWFGLKVGDVYVEPSFATDVLFENPEKYLTLVFSCLESHDKVLKKEAGL
jgi:hypothetical protein